MAHAAVWYDGGAVGGITGRTPRTRTPARGGGAGRRALNRLWIRFQREQGGDSLEDLRGQRGTIRAPVAPQCHLPSLSADELPSLSGQPLGHESTFCLFDLQFPLSLLQPLLSYRQGVVPFPHFTDEFLKCRGAVIY